MYLLSGDGSLLRPLLRISSLIDLGELLYKRVVIVHCLVSGTSHIASLLLLLYGLRSLLNTGCGWRWRLSGVGACHRTKRQCTYRQTFAPSADFL